eukprot:Gb_19569 [translate_table: standard]
MKLQGSRYSPGYPFSDLIASASEEKWKTKQCTQCFRRSRADHSHSAYCGDGCVFVRQFEMIIKNARISSPSAEAFVAVAQFRTVHTLENSSSGNIKLKGNNGKQNCVNDRCPCSHSRPAKNWDLHRMFAIGASTGIELATRILVNATDPFGFACGFVENYITRVLV